MRNLGTDDTVSSEERSEDVHRSTLSAPAKLPSPPSEWRYLSLTEAFFNEKLNGILLSGRVALRKRGNILLVRVALTGDNHPEGQRRRNKDKSQVRVRSGLFLEEP